MLSPIRQFNGYISGATQERAIQEGEGTLFDKDRVVTKVGKRTVRMLIYRPNPNEVENVSDRPVMVNSGILTDARHYLKFGAAMAAEGLMPVLWTDDRQLSIRDQIDPKHWRDVFLTTGEVGAGVAEIAANETDAGKVDMFDFSKGGMSGAKIGALYPDTGNIVKADPAGMVGNMAKAFIRRNPNAVMESLDREFVVGAMWHAARNGLLLAREFADLGGNPDFSDDLMTAKMRGSKAGLMLFGGSLVFPTHLMEEAAAQSDEFETVKTLEGLPHGAPMSHSEIVAKETREMYEHLRAIEEGLGRQALTAATDHRQLVTV